MIIDKVKWLDAGFLPVYYGFCPSVPAWNKEMKRLGVKDEPYPTTAGRVTQFQNIGNSVKDCMIVTINNDGYNRNEISALIAHEAIHVFQFACEEMGEENPSPEFEAYAIQYITLKLIQAYEETIGWPITAE